jgi:hypothetical protein
VVAHLKNHHAWQDHLLIIKHQHASGPHAMHSAHVYTRAQGMARAIEPLRKCAWHGNNLIESR